MEEARALKEKIELIKVRRMRIMDVSLEAPLSIRQKYIDSTFFMDIWQKLKSQRYYEQDIQTTRKSFVEIENFRLLKKYNEH